MTGEPVARPAARVVLLDPADRVLLLRFGGEDGGAGWWATPGGGVQPGETSEQAALREVHEETGLERVPIGPCIWVREHVFPWGQTTWRQQEHFYLARVEAFEPSRAGLDDNEQQLVREHRWWTLSELEGSHEEISPRRLATLLRSLLAEGPPPTPLDAGV
ncbi:MAG: NUDIX domain-containing protein [Candidatus Dormibacteraeota bacterium]|nr:NUDIX domain-containing protein [Candidatus Dormibacteraeota bacterium]